jgi:hypothetical protein
MAHLVEFRLLGALEVVIAGRPVILGAGGSRLSSPRSSCRIHTRSLATA